MRNLSDVEAREINGGRTVVCPICGYEKVIKWYEFWNFSVNQTSLASVHRGKRVIKTSDHR